MGDVLDSEADAEPMDFVAIKAYPGEHPTPILCYTVIKLEKPEKPEKSGTYIVTVYDSEQNAESEFTDSVLFIYKELIYKRRRRDFNKSRNSL